MVLLWKSDAEMLGKKTRQDVQCIHELMWVATSISKKCRDSY